MWSKLAQNLHLNPRLNPDDSKPTTTPSNHQQPPQQEEEYTPLPSDYPTFPPPPPRTILANPKAYFTTTILPRKYAAPRGEFVDKPLYALYRFYEFILLDDVTNYRNCLEAFWRQKGPEWAVSDIPDPRDDDPERYAVLAACTYLIVRAFNARVKLGLDRRFGSIITSEEAEMLRGRGEGEKRYEKVPGWAEGVERLGRVLVVPTGEGEVLGGLEDERADGDFLGKGILLWTPHVHFT